ncbi:hypothetical protein NDA01_24115 [Trichocoleus desertorum AS-A10]|uniref:hypothetical protein n=1 Tax=Trichocoleus desertorum TaxID=1481672 RepID=UPI003297B9F2
MSAGKQKPKLNWYESDSPALIVVMLIVFFPLGLWSMWRYAKWPNKTKGIVTGAVVAIALVAGVASPDEETQEAAQPSPVPAKTITFAEQLETPVGPLPLVKYSGDSCLYAKATTAHTGYYGMDKLKDELKSKYNVTCVFWEE